ncbi:MAG TPA: hypothetical protein DF383_10950 [Deltaproteobacteria bacterium]|nr:hypothetical protein [Deltaproteobacteria bacterium]
MVFCHHCGKTCDLGERIGRTETCPFCHADLHVCYNCLHYDASAYNECRESQAERVLEKDRANFCDYFAPSDHAVRKEAGKKSEDVKAKLDALFKKT